MVSLKRAAVDAEVATTKESLKAAGIVNLDKPVKQVFHSELERVDEEHPFRSWCPVCDKGILLTRRADVTGTGITMGSLLRLDHCLTCGQRFLYLDDTINGEKPGPSVVVAREVLRVQGLSLEQEEPSKPPTAWERLKGDDEI